jgi:hypothetical protein
VLSLNEGKGSALSEQTHLLDLQQDNSTFQEYVNRFEEGVRRSVSAYPQPQGNSRDSWKRTHPIYTYLYIKGLKKHLRDALKMNEKFASAFGDGFDKVKDLAGKVNVQLETASNSSSHHDSNKATRNNEKQKSRVVGGQQKSTGTGSFHCSLHGENTSHNTDQCKKLNSASKADKQRLVNEGHLKQKRKAEGVCFNCGKKGHKSYACPRGNQE